MMKIATFLAILCAIIGLLCVARAAPKQKRDLSNMKDLIKEIKAESNTAQAQDNDQDEAIAQLFLKLLEKEAKAEADEGSDDKLAQTDSIFNRIRNFFHRVKTKFHNFGGKVRKFFRPKG
jgi:uncharacterized membrane protein YccC